MSTYSQFAGANRVPSSIVNFGSSGGQAQVAPPTSATALAKTYLSGSQTANTLATATGLSQVNGSGVISLLHVGAVDATSRTVRVKLTVDGTSRYDSTSAAAVTGSDYGVTVVQPGEYPIFYNESFKIEICSSLTETDKLRVYLNYKAFS